MESAQGTVDMKEECITYSHRYVLAFSIVLGAFLRFYHIGSQPLWLDEAWSYWFSGRTIRELWTIIPQFETNPPLYYTILKLWEGLFGSTEACLRSLSAVMSIGCIPLIYLVGRHLGKTIGGNWLGTISALLFAVSPVHIQYAQETRPYAMLTFATTLTLLAVLWIMRHPAEACEPIFRRASDMNPHATEGIAWPGLFPWMLMIIAISFALWLHNTSVLYMVTLLLVVLAWVAVPLEFNRNVLTKILMVVVITFLLWIPYLVYLIPQSLNASLPIPKPTILSTINTVTWLLLGNSITWGSSINDILKMTVFLFLIILAATGLIHIRKHSGLFVSLLILAGIVGPILMELLFSVTLRPIFLARTIIYVSVPFYISIAAGIMMLGSTRKSALAVILITFVFTKWTYGYFANFQKESWDKVAQTVSYQAGGDVVLFVPNSIEIPFSYYAQRIINNNLHVIPLPCPISDFLRQEPGMENLVSDPFKAICIKPSDVSSIDRAIGNKSPVWLITRREELFDRDKIVFNRLTSKRNLVATLRFGEIDVFKFN